MVARMRDAAAQRNEITLVTAMAPIEAARHGERAKCLQRLVRMGLPVPTTVALPFETVRSVAQGGPLDMDALLAFFGPAPLLTVRPSSQDPDWGGPGTVLLVGMNPARHAALSDALGAEVASALHRRFVETYAVQVARLDPDALASDTLEDALRTYEAETGEPFPEDPARQLMDVVRSMARAWEGTSARLLREARGAPAEAGLGLVVQAMALGVGPGESGSGVVQFVDAATGARRPWRGATCRSRRAAWRSATPRRCPWRETPAALRSNRAAPRRWRRCARTAPSAARGCARRCRSSSP